MRFLLFLFISSSTLAQQDLDSLRWAVDSLNRSLLEDIKRFESEGTDFVILRNNDSLSVWYNSYHVFFNLDSCTKGYCISVDPELVSPTEKRYDLHYIHSAFVDAGASRRCKDRLYSIHNDLNKGYIIAREHKILSVSDLVGNEYLLYGKIGNQYILEQFDHSFIAKFHSGMVYDLTCRFGNICN